MIKLFRKNHFLRNKVHNTSCILNHASPRHLKQYSRKRTNESLSLFASELDRKPSMVKRRESRHVQSLRGIDLWLWYSLPFDSLRIRLRRRKWKSKQKSVDGTAEQSADALLGNEDSRKPYSNADLLGERKSKSMGRSCSLKSTRRHIRAKDRRSSHQWSIFWKKKTLCASRRFYFLRAFSIDFLNNFLLDSFTLSSRCLKMLWLFFEFYFILFIS